MRISIVVLLLISATPTAMAWAGDSVLFVDGAFLGDHDGSRWIQTPMALGGSGAIGFRASRHFSVRFEAEVPGIHARTLTTNYPGLLNTSDTESFRTITYGALFAVHYPVHQRVDVAFLVGLSEAIHDTRNSGYSDTTLLRTVEVVHEEFTSRSSDSVGAVTAGVDAAVNLTRHLAIVPEVRFHLYNEYGAVTRPKVAVRWTF